MRDQSPPARIETLLVHAEWLRALARRLVGSDDVAGDVEQETWLVALERPPRDATSPRRWLAAVLRNIVRERRRNDLARRTREAGAARDEAVDDTTQAIDRAHSLRALIEAVLELDEPYRSSVLLRYQDGLSIEDIARRENVTPSTVRNRLSRGIARLRERLERRHGRAWSAVLLPLCPPLTLTGGGTAVGGGSIAAFLSMATIKFVSVAAALVVGAALWWSLSDEMDTPGGTRGVDTTAETRETLQAPVSETLALPQAAERSAARSDAALETSPSPSDAASATRGSITVAVVWQSDGTPARDVVVRMFAWAESSPFAFAMGRATDAQGLVRFEDVAAGSVLIEADRAEGVQVQVGAGQERRVALEIPPGVLVRGRVVDARDTAVGFARIWLSTCGNTTEGHEVAVTDALGRFELRDVGDGRHIAARATGHAPSNSQSILGQPGDSVELVLRLGADGCQLRGSVVGVDDVPLPGALLVIGSESSRHAVEEGAVHPISPPPHRLACDEHGQFVIDGLASGRTRVQCRARGYAPLELFVELAPGPAAALRLQLSLGASIEGVVRDASGKALDEIAVGVGDGYGNFASSYVTTDAEGRYSIRDLRPGSTALRFRGDDRGDADATAVLVAGETVRLDVQLVQRRGIAGRVVDERGQALPGLRVGAIDGANPGLHHRTAITDDTGAFRLDNWPSEADALEVRDADRWTGPSLSIVTPIEVGREDLVVTVPSDRRATAYIVGQLRGPDGEAVPGASVHWGTPMSMDAQFEAELSATTGAFRAGPMPASRQRLWASAPGFGQLDIGLHEVEAGETLDLGALRFAAPGRLRIRLTGSRELLDSIEGEDLFARVEGPNGFWLGQIELDAGLQGRSSPLPAGPCTVIVTGEGMRAPSVSAEVRAGVETELSIAVEPATSRLLSLKWKTAPAQNRDLRARVVDAEGRTVQDGEVFTAADGTSRLIVQGLVVGRYWVELTSAEETLARPSFDVRDLAPSSEWIELDLP